MMMNESGDHEQQHNEGDAPRPSVDFGWNIFGAEFDPENPHTAIEESPPKEQVPVNATAVPIQDASVVTHVEGEIVKLTSPDKKRTQPEQQTLPPIQPSSTDRRSQDQSNRNSSSRNSQSKRPPMPPMEPAAPPEQTACCADPGCVIS